MQNNHNLHHRCTPCAQVGNQLALSEPIFVEHVECAISCKLMHCGRYEQQRSCNSSTQTDFISNGLHTTMRSGCNQLCEGSLTELWHHQLGHLDMRSIFALQNMLRKMTLGKISRPTSTLVCEACMRVSNIPDIQEVSDKTIGDRTFGCLWPHKDHVCGRDNFFVIFVDDFLRMIWVHMMKSKR